VQPTAYEKKLWHWYDATDYALNLFDCPTVAYSGEIDSQKQAADMMAEALSDTGLELTHIIGPKTGHAYHPAAKPEINRRIDRLVAHGRDPLAPWVRFTTWTLRYNRCFWVTLDELDEHWSRAAVEARLDPYKAEVQTRNLAALTVSIPFVDFPDLQGRESLLPFNVVLDGKSLPIRRATDRSVTAHFRKVDGHWQQVSAADDGTLRKRHGLQGPIDDAFMDRFLMVRPTGKPLNDKVGAWAKAEMEHAVDHWRRQFRGDAPQRDDTEVKDSDIAGSNLVLWGDPSSNRVLAKIAGRLPVHWDADGVHVGGKTYAAGHHVPVLVYPNPLNPKRYVVLNSGFTFREYDYENNARQVPKLPDWAVVDVDVPVSYRLPGGVVAADFFDEKWQLKAAAE
jgi:hypothetical protein